MQRISFRKVKTSVYHVQPTDDDILHFSLDDLLPEGHTLALNLSLGTLSLIANSHDTSYPFLLAEQQFTTSELCVLVPLLKSSLSTKATFKPLVAASRAIPVPVAPPPMTRRS